MEHMREENSRDIFPIERATILYNMSFFVLNHCQSEHNRKSCCPLANLHLPDVVSWLLNAFVIFREIPLLFLKVSKLLALMLISTKRHILVPLFSVSLGNIFPSSFPWYLHIWPVHC